MEMETGIPEVEARSEHARPRALLLRFEEAAKAGLLAVGGKAAVLAQLAERGFPVPPGVVLTRAPERPEEWLEVFTWWTSLGRPPLAVRSSAVGEDSSELSFAGQQTSVLNVSTEATIQSAVDVCFASVMRAASLAYRQHFGQSNDSFRMNVVLQVMIDPCLSGVFFSLDPRGTRKGWMLEVIQGLGEDLVSGRKTPACFYEHTKIWDTSVLPELETEDIMHVAHIGEEAKKVLGYDVDMEWSIDRQKKLWCLQARPITAVHSHFHHRQEVERELGRLKKQYSPETLWDGQTFAEWTGVPSYLTFSLWKKAFSVTGAFSLALRKLGYVGSSSRDMDPKQSLLERVFGRAYVNLSRMEPLYFGRTPYAMVAHPRPHLEFRWSRVTPKAILRAPKAMGRMWRVAWNLQTRRRFWLDGAVRALNDFRQQSTRPLDPKVYENWETQRLLGHLTEEVDRFCHQALLWPFVLIVMAESTHQSLQAHLRRLFGAKEADATLRRWLAAGIETVSAEMNFDYYEACVDRNLRPFFLARYGHRGPGELDLTNPRWFELGDKAFHAPHFHANSTLGKPSVEEDITRLGKFRAPHLLQEWKLLKEMLELREKWKMELLKPYAHLRWILLELGKRTSLNDDIFWLRLSEIQDPDVFGFPEKLKKRVSERKARFHVFKHLSFPAIVSLQEMEDILHGRVAHTGLLEGEGLSPGLAYGEVRVVTDPRNIRFEDWPENTILVAEATDPGWTPLFSRVKGIVVEKGGVLSHCAIVAREMGVPAVSGIARAHYRLKEGMHVWVDGGSGRVWLADG